VRISTLAFAAITAALSVAVGMTAALGGEGGLINTTPSYPRGLYLPLGRAAQVGDLVAFCPGSSVANYAMARRYLNPGRCPSGSVPLIKRLAAAGGDQVTIGPAGVIVDGRVLKNSRPMARDGLGRPLPQLRLSVILAAGQVLLMSDYEAASFDSRYFGPLDGAGVLRAMRPVLTWPWESWAIPAGTAAD
jgi:conjugative transfer signal peptidase TraF